MTEGFELALVGKDRELFDQGGGRNLDAFPQPLFQSLTPFGAATGEVYQVRDFTVFENLVLHFGQQCK